MSKDDCPVVVRVGVAPRFVDWVNDVSSLVVGELRAYQMVK
jgi:hypothetical protein